MPQKITTFLWFDNNAEQAVEHYTYVFPNSKVLSLGRSSPDGPLLTATFELEGQQFMALNGGPRFRFTEAISMFVSCESQAEVDDLWAKLSDGGAPGRCGWLKDRFGISWQIIPNALGELMSDPDPEKSKRVMMAMFQMNKIDIEGLKRAHAGV
jgi:predicted 3-demethylubiquinone-9 3-methyltransferase (glyoxalase superfamily)